jgi:hypothetical protein
MPSRLIHVDGVVLPAQPSASVGRKTLSTRSWLLRWSPWLAFPRGRAVCPVPLFDHVSSPRVSRVLMTRSRVPAFRSPLVVCVWRCFTARFNLRPIIDVGAIPASEVPHKKLAASDVHHATVTTDRLVLQPQVATLIAAD